MEAVVKINFRDKDNFDKEYIKGKKYEFSPERYAELVDLGLLEKVEDKKVEDKKGNK